MNKSFTFRFENANPKLCRVYNFELEFNDLDHFEECLDWAETTEDISNFITEMDKYGTHEVLYEPNDQFFGFESYDILPKNYIKVMESWKNFFMTNNIECGDIEEVHDNTQLISFG